MRVCRKLDASDDGRHPVCNAKSAALIFSRWVILSKRTSGLCAKKQKSAQRSPTVCHHSPGEPDVFGPDFPVLALRRMASAHSLAFEPAAPDRVRKAPSAGPFLIHFSEGTDAARAANWKRLTPPAHSVRLPPSCTGHRLLSSRGNNHARELPRRATCPRKRTCDALDLGQSRILRREAIGRKPLPSDGRGRQRAEGVALPQVKLAASSLLPFLFQMATCG
jgi:hypothetical protein